MSFIESILCTAVVGLSVFALAQYYRNRRLEKRFAARGRILIVFARNALYWVDSSPASLSRDRSGSALLDEFPGLSSFNEIVEQVVPEDL